MVNHDLQFRLIREVSRIPLIALMAGMLLVVWEFRVLIQEALTDGVSMPKVYGFIACIFGYVLLACYLTIRTATRASNRIAGPLYRLHKSMEQLSRGDTNCKIKLRDGDYLTDTIAHFNQFVDRVGEKAASPASAEDRMEQNQEKHEQELVGV